MNINKTPRGDEQTYKAIIGTPCKRFKEENEPSPKQSVVKKALFFTPLLAKQKKEGQLMTPEKAKPANKLYTYEDLDKVKKRLTFDEFLEFDDESC